MRKKHRKQETSGSSQTLYSRRESLAEGLELPKDVSCGMVIVTVTGRRSLVLEHYQGIIAFDDDCIRIRTKECNVCIFGDRLKVDYYTNEEMKIIGVIRQISYEV